MIVVIPTIYESPYLPDLLQVLHDDREVVSVLLVDNSPYKIEMVKMDTATQIPMMKLRQEGRGMTLRTNGLSIYSSWRMGIEMGDNDDEFVALLNDDIVLPPGSLAAARAAFDQPCPNSTEGWGLMGLNYFEPNREVDATAPVREVVGTYRTQGFGGFAFVVPPDSPLPDDEYRWWYGDDDLGEKIKATGRKLGLATGAPVDHPQPGTSSRKHPRPAEDYQHDLDRYRRIWPDAP